MASGGASAAGPARPVPDDVAVLPVDPATRKILMALIIGATVMQVLDSTIANVALPHMQGALGAAPDTITWVLTSYIVAAAVATPVTGWLADRFGRRALLIAAVAGFTFASTICAFAISLPMMVGARLLQGVFGAFIVPVGQSLMLDINPRSRHAQALTLWGLAAMVAPVLGPVLGGWLTDAFDWRWVFLINLPIGIVGLFGLVAFMPRGRGSAGRFDGIGFALLLIAIAAFQLMLDRGAQNDWFDATETWIEAGLAAGAGWMFVVHTITARAPLMPVALFRDRNLVISTICVLLVIGLMLASSALLPPLLQRMLGHSAYQAGVLTAPRGVGMAIAMIVAGRLARTVDRRILLLIGLATSAWSVWLMMGFSLEMDSRPVIVSGLIQGVGFGFVFLPLNMMAFTTLDPRYRTQGAGLYNLSRSLGGSIAISSITALLTRQGQISHADLAANITDQTVPLAALTMAGRLGVAPETALSMIDSAIDRQAAMIAYIDAFTAMFWLLLAAMPLVLLMRPNSAAADTPAMAAID